jgi:hypothetical protein
VIAAPRHIDDVSVHRARAWTDPSGEDVQHGHRRAHRPDARARHRCCRRIVVTNTMADQRARSEDDRSDGAARPTVGAALGLGRLLRRRACTLLRALRRRPARTHPGARSHEFWGDDE